MGKKDLSEEDIKTQYITPAIEKAGWDVKTQVRFEYPFTAGRIILRGKITARGSQKRADYLLFYKPNLPIAIIEAKDNNHAAGAGLQQAIDYANTLDIKYVYASNGDMFVEQNLITGEVKNVSLDDFPSPDDMYKRYCVDMGIATDDNREKAMLQPDYFAPNYKEARYYQRIAINRTVDAVASGKDRVLLVCATGDSVIIMTSQAKTA